MATKIVQSQSMMIHVLKENLLKFGDPVIFDSVDNECCTFSSGSLYVRYVGPYSRRVCDAVAAEFGIERDRGLPKNRDWSRMKGRPRFTKC